LFSQESPWFREQLFGPRERIPDLTLPESLSVSLFRLSPNGARPNEPGPPAPGRREGEGPPTVVNSSSVVSKQKSCLYALLFVPSLPSSACSASRRIFFWVCVQNFSLSFPTFRSDPFRVDMSESCVQFPPALKRVLCTMSFRSTC